MASSKLRIDLSGISKREMEEAWAELNGKVATQPIATRVGKVINFTGNGQSIVALKDKNGKLPEWAERLGKYLQGKELKSN